MLFVVNKLFCGFCFFFLRRHLLGYSLKLWFSLAMESTDKFLCMDWNSLTFSAEERNWST